MSATRVDVSQIDVLGDAHAPPGSAEWAIFMRLEAQGALADAVMPVAHLARVLQLMREHRGWARLLDQQGQPFASYAAFCVTKRPWGLGEDPEHIEYLIAERSRTASQRALDATPARRRGRPPKTEGLNKGSAPTFNGRRDADYLAARIARDRPDILARMQAGAFKSVREAAIAAGIVQPRRAIPGDVDGLMRAIAEQLDGGQRAELLRRLAERYAAAPTTAEAFLDVVERHLNEDQCCELYGLMARRYGPPQPMAQGAPR
jgi:hypothetical protein